MNPARWITDAYLHLKGLLLAPMRAVLSGMILTRDPWRRHVELPL